MWQQFVNAVGSLGWEALQDILQIGVRVMPVELG
jgi:hypothetical protein